MVTVEYIDNKSTPVRLIRATSYDSKNTFVAAGNFTELDCAIYTAESQADTVIMLSRGDAIAFARALLAGFNETF